MVTNGYKSCQSLGVSAPVYFASFVKSLSPGASVVSGMLLVTDIWSAVQFNKVKAKYYDMGKTQWLKSTYAHTWKNRGQNSGYVRSSTPTLKIVNNKGD